MRGPLTEVDAAEELRLVQMHGAFLRVDDARRRTP